MAGRRKQHHEEHMNHEAWAIPYGDLITLLLAFFVVMYAISSINEGKYRVLADALSSAFGGPPRTVTPIQLGMHQLRGSAFDRPSLVTPGSKSGPSSSTPIAAPRMRQVLDMPTFGGKAGAAQQVALEESREQGEQQLHSIGRRIQDALSELVKQKLVTVRRSYNFLEVEIQSDILFASGVAVPNPQAVDTVRRISAVLREEPNAMRVEGYTDNVPIATSQFPSNWELSSARAASIVHVMAQDGISPSRLAVVGYGEFQPVADNATPQGRNANRRVLLVILANPQGPDALEDRTPATIAMQDETTAPAVDADLFPAASSTPSRSTTAPSAPGAATAAARAHAAGNDGIAADTARAAAAAKHSSTSPGAG
ncbi:MULTISPECIES: flagellar motor protein MotD [unclassified Lysobacter]|uniref:flagellar motor protein MotD n=1 Tax=unclassified Lysobacter TaxID=2635362 RepID=UPI001C249505|nr:flagellar motor protein MotD [Lysobacter sp. MMG2]MBU8976767.1 flagellar motor protein MotD [Lysobacter sp. MMG2]